MTKTEKLFELLKDMPYWYKDMLLGIHTDNMAMSTKCEYARDVNKFFEWLIANNSQFKNKKDITLEDIEKLTSSDANEYATYLQTLAPSTMSRKLAAVSSMYIELMRYGKVAKNPFAVVRRPKKKKGVITYLTEQEISALFDVIRKGEGLTPKEKSLQNKERDIALYSLFLDTGMRLSEVTNLDRKFVDLDDCSLIATRKGGKHEQLYFSDATKIRLQEYLDTKNLKDEPEPLFTNSRGTRLSQRSIEYLTEKYASIAFPNKHISPHKLRSTFAMYFYEQTHDLLLLKDKMGHANIATTNIYAESVKERMKETRNISPL